MLKLVTEENNKSKLAHRQFFLSSCPFNLAANIDFTKAPSRESYYTSIGASPELIAWLKANDCDTVYCRELRAEEVTCKIGDKGCVREFVQAYNEALRELKDKEKARKWVTMYGDLSKKDLRIGFYLKKMEWLESAIKQLESDMRQRAKEQTSSSFIRSALSDEEGVVIFYDVCPAMPPDTTKPPDRVYYFSSISPIEYGDQMVYWDSAISNFISQRLSPITVAPITLAFPSNDPSKNKDAQKRLVGKPAPAHADGQKPASP